MKNNKVRIEKNYKDTDMFNNEYEVMKELKANNMIKERIELYRDFIVNLVCYAHTTYFGKEYLKREEDIKGHFTWAFNKVIKEFALEDIKFKNTDKLYDYFYEYFRLQFYDFDPLPTIKSYMTFWDDIFSIYPKKQKNIMKILIDLYHIFDSSLEVTKKLVES